LSYGAAKGSDGEFFVNRDYATFILSAKDDVATALPYLNVSKTLEYFDGLGSGNTWKLSHERKPRTWS